MRTTACIVIAVVASACVSTNAVVLAPTPAGAAAARPKVLPEQVRIYRTADQVKAKYEEIALLNSTGESSWTNEKGMVESMRRKAGELGANGIILDAINEASSGAKVAGAFLGTGTQRKGKSIAIFVFPDSTNR